MSSPSTALPISAGRRRLGWVLSALFALFLALDSVAHIARPQPVIDAFAALGIPLRYSLPLGVVLLLYVLLYLVPQTATFGAILLTGYLGGAVASHMRVSDGFFPLLFPVLIGAGLWVGLALRKPAIARLFVGTD